MNIVELDKHKSKKYNEDNFYVPTYNAFMRKTDLNLQQKSIYLYFLGFGDKCFRSQDKICEDLHITKPTLRKLMEALEEKKYIYVQRRYSEKTKEKSTPIIFPIPIDELTGMLTKYTDNIINHYKEIYPSDYFPKKNKK